MLWWAVGGDRLTCERGIMLIHHLSIHVSPVRSFFSFRVPAICWVGFFCVADIKRVRAGKARRREEGGGWRGLGGMGGREGGRESERERERGKK